MCCLFGCWEKNVRWWQICFIAKKMQIRLTVGPATSIYSGGPKQWPAEEE